MSNTPGLDTVHRLHPARLRAEADEVAHLRDLVARGAALDRAVRDWAAERAKLSQAVDAADQANDGDLIAIVVREGAERVRLCEARMQKLVGGGA